MNIRAWMLLLALPAAAAAQQNLIVNGTFDAPDGPLSGWNTDYAWTKNSFYVGNASRVQAVEQFAGQRNAVRLRPHGDAGTKIESVLIPFEQGAQYRATLKVQGGRFRIYFSGYQWKPGIRPHSAPTLPEMQQAYRSKAVDDQAGSWKTITLDIPGVQASDTSIKHLSKVRFITLYIWFLGEGHVDDVRVVRVK